MNEKQLKYSVQITMDVNNQTEIRCSAPFPELVRLVLTAIDVAAQRQLEATEDETMREIIAQDMYNLINLGASTLLQKLFPEIEMRPDITVDAILAAEDKIIDEQPEKVKAAHEAYLDSTNFAKDMATSKNVKEKIRQEKKDSLNLQDHKKKTSKRG